MSQITEVKKRLVWLASYPKSGNTWIRIFLSALLNRKQPDLNSGLGNIYSSYLSENILDLNMDGLSRFERYNFRIKAYEYLNQQLNSFEFIKIHDSYNDPMGYELIPANSTHLCIYIVRNPLAIVPSLANHMNRSFDFAIKNYLINTNARLSSNPKKASDQMEQFLGTWQDHVNSWISQSDVPVLVIKYEDLKSDPLSTFRSIVEALGLTYEDSEILEAIENSSFEKLRKMESEIGFIEKPVTSKSFFYKGKSDYWKEVLKPYQIKLVIEKNEPMMLKFGYI